jgi:EAL domain-containing protein (putative c-di-GMP-specific phosphodiesterase class I)
MAIETKYKLLINKKEVLQSFLETNKNNKSASVIWVKAINKRSLQKKIGYLGFKDLCATMYEKLPLFMQDFNIKFKLTDGIFVLASTNLNRQQAHNWVIKLQQWSASNNFSINQKYYYFNINFVVLSNIHIKKNIHTLIQKSEKLLLNDKSSKAIEFLDESIKEEHYYFIRNQLITALKTKNFNWLFQAIVPTREERLETHELMLHIKTDRGEELGINRYIDIANRLGILHILDKYTLEFCINTINSNNQKNYNTRILLNQCLTGYKSLALINSRFELINRNNLPRYSIMFQFSLLDAIEHMDILQELARRINQASFTICLSDFDCTNIAWKVARKLNTNWLKLKSFSKADQVSYTLSLERISKTVRKAHILGYKVFISKVDSIYLAADLWKLEIDFLQGDFSHAQEDFFGH